MSPEPSFEAVLRETLAEVEAAEAIEASEAQQALDEVEQLRLQAAHLVSHSAGGPWATGAPVQFQQDPAEQVTAPPTLDIRFPARPLPAAAGKSGVESSVGRQGRRVP